MTASRNRPAAVAASLIALLVAAGCGGGGDDAAFKPGPLPAGVQQAEKVDPATFPAVKGRTLEDVLQEATGQATFAPGVGTLQPGRNRLGFAVIGQDGQPVYGPTVVYVAQSPGSTAKGPFAAPIDAMIPQEKFLSKQSALAPEQLKAIYGAEVDLPKNGKWSALSLTRTDKGLVAGTFTGLTVAPHPTVPKVGERAPSVSTATGSGPMVDTRDPKAPSLHSENLSAVLGKKPVALLFASPQYCQTRVCGPVTDILLQLQAAYGDRIAMIQQEPYSKPPLPALQMRGFGLVAPDGAFTEPWMFTIDAKGRIAARLEGAFGIDEMRAAIDAALRQ